MYQGVVAVSAAPTPALCYIGTRTVLGMLVHQPWREGQGLAGVVFRLGPGNQAKSFPKASFPLGVMLTARERCVRRIQPRAM